MGLGVTAEWVAGHLGTQTRTVQRWESGTNTIKTAAAEALLTLEAQAAEQVTAHISALRRSRRPPVLTIDDINDTNTWPAGWQQMIAFRVRQQVPGLRIVDRHDASTAPKHQR